MLNCFSNLLKQTLCEEHADQNLLLILVKLMMWQL